jgi:DHA1 family multidrug resistance protein-like MFS transporter
MGQGENFVWGIRRVDIEQSLFVGFLMVVATVEFIKMGLIMMLLPSLFVGLNYSRLALGWVLSANLFADNLCKSATGWFVDREGPWPVLLSGCLVVLVGLLLLILGIYCQIYLIVIAAVLIGIGGSPTWPAAIAGAIKIKGEDKRVATISLISIVWMIGSGLGVFLVGLLIGEHSLKFVRNSALIFEQVYAKAFALLLIVAMLALLITVWGWRFGKKVDRWERHSFRGKQQPRLAVVFEQIKQVGSLVPGMFFQTFSLGMLLPNLLPFTVQKLGFTELQYYLLLITGGAVAVVFMNPVGRLIDRLGARFFLVGGFFLAAVTLVVMVNYGNAATIWFVVAFLGLSYALIQPAWNGILVAAIPPDQRGVLMGLFMSVEGLGFAAGPLFGGWLGGARLAGWWGRLGAGLPFMVSAVFLVIMAIVYLVHPLPRYELEG